MAATRRNRIVWKESYKLGIRGVDEDHFVLVSMLSHLEEAVYCGQGRTTTGQLLRNLASYVKVHFTREERLMKSHQYPDLTLTEPCTTASREPSSGFKIPTTSKAAWTLPMESFAT